MKIYSVAITPVSPGTITSIDAGICGTQALSIPISTAISAATIEAALNAAWTLGDPLVVTIDLFSVSYNGSSQTFTISTKCTSCNFVSMEVTTGVTPVDILFTEESTCDLATITFTSDGDCGCGGIQFNDATGLYNVSTNTTGYGYPPNYPSISDIDHVEFILFDVNNSLKQYVYDSSEYIPQADGSNEVCILAPNFLAISDGTPLSSFVGGKLYLFQYRIYLKNGESLQGINDFFVYPCCGTGVISNLGTNYSVLQKVGCTSIDFTDITGVYDATTNPGGYGSPNPTYADIDSTEIIFEFADGTSATITDFIPAANALTVNITGQELGFEDGNIPDQIVNITYNVYSPCLIGRKEDKILFHCNTRNCIKKKSRDLLKADCHTCQEDKSVNNTFNLIQRYEYLLLAFEQGGCTNGDIEQLYKDCIKDCPTCN